MLLYFFVFRNVLTNPICSVFIEMFRQFRLQKKFCSSIFHPSKLHKILTSEISVRFSEIFVFREIRYVATLIYTYMYTYMYIRAILSRLTYSMYSFVFLCVIFIHRQLPVRSPPRHCQHLYKKKPLVSICPDCVSRTAGLFFGMLSCLLRDSGSGAGGGGGRSVPGWQRREEDYTVVETCVNL